MGLVVDMNPLSKNIGSLPLSEDNSVERFPPPHFLICSQVTRKGGGALSHSTFSLHHSFEEENAHITPAL